MTFLCTRAGIDTISTGALINSTPQVHVAFNGFLVAVVGATVASHGGGAHAAATFAAGSPVFAINGLPVVRQGLPATCAHVANGSAHVMLST